MTLFSMSITLRQIGIEVKDFGKSWRTGLAFHSVIHAIRPELVDLEKVKSRSNRENLEDAFTIAETQLGIPRLLDPEGMWHDPQLICVGRSMFACTQPNMKLESARWNNSFLCCVSSMCHRFQRIDYDANVPDGPLLLVYYPGAQNLKYPFSGSKFIFLYPKINAPLRPHQSFFEQWEVFNPEAHNGLKCGK